MEKILATWKDGPLVEADTLPMCSASERDELVRFPGSWQYQLPVNWGFFKTKPTVGEFLLVVDSEDETHIIGYACPVYCISLGMKYRDMLEAEEGDPDMFAPHLVVICREQDVQRHIDRQQALLDEGSWGD